MTVQQVIDIASMGELKNLSVSKDTTDVLSFINLGMIELYKRFPLNVNEVVITLGSTGDTVNPYTMINDEIYKMPSDFMWIVAAYEEVPEDSEEVVIEVPINEEDNPLSLNTISWNKVQIPITVTGSFISIIYVASPIYYTSLDLEADLELPPQMLEALLHYIGYRGHTSVTGEIQAEHTTHYTRFEASCARIERMGMFTSDDLSLKGRISTRGFI